jgi:hypothetical protein
MGVPELNGVKFFNLDSLPIGRIALSERCAISISAANIAIGYSWRAAMASSRFMPTRTARRPGCLVGGSDANR